MAKEREQNEDVAIAIDAFLGSSREIVAAGTVATAGFRHWCQVQKIAPRQVLKDWTTTWNTFLGSHGNTVPEKKAEEK